MKFKRKKYIPKHGIYIGDCLEVLKTLPNDIIHCVVTSPPYFGLRDYGVDGQIGLEQTQEEYVQKMVEVFREVKRVLRDDGVCFVNLGDSYNGSGGAGGDYGSGGLKEGQPKYPGRKIATLKPKDLIGIPWRVAFALQADGWYLRQDIIWHKPNPMPESVTDRCTKAHEYIFLLSKSARYYYDTEAIKESASCKFNGGGGNKGRIGTEGWKGRTKNKDMSRNKRSVWTVTIKPFKKAHFATFPPKLIEPCILAGCPKEVCSECGAPVERVVDRVAANPGQKQGYTMNCTGRNDGTRAGSWTDGTTKTTGWQSTCKCNAKKKPGIVLDPFAGSGTTGEVALSHRREFIGIELNKKYALDFIIPRIKLQKERNSKKLF